MKNYRTHIRTVIMLIILAGVFFFFNDSREPLNEAPSISTEAQTVIPSELSQMPKELLQETTTFTEALSETTASSESTEGITEKKAVSKVNPPKTPSSSLPASDSKAMTCSLTVSCKNILKNLDNLNPDKKELIPADGIIYTNNSIPFEEGDTIFDILLREMKNNNIHLEYNSTPAYNSTYIEGINNLYEFDCGELSGWTYTINGEMANYGCNNYTIKNGDVIKWIYTCNLGSDLIE